jgi:hypothetical protein
VKPFQIVATVVPRVEPMPTHRTAGEGGRTAARDGRAAGRQQQVAGTRSNPACHSRTAKSPEQGDKRNFYPFSRRIGMHNLTWSVEDT